MTEAQAHHVRTPTIALGAWDWRHESWQGVFYPQDLPLDWQLTFYANEFDAVGLPTAAWLNPPLAELESWLENTQAGFRFHLVMPSAVLKGEEDIFAQITERLSLLQPRLGSVLLPTATEACMSMLGLLLPAGVPAYGLHAGRLVPQAMPDFHAVMDQSTAPLVMLGHESVAPTPAAQRSRQRALRAGMDALALRRKATILVQDDAPNMLTRLEELRSLRALLGWH